MLSWLSDCDLGLTPSQLHCRWQELARTRSLNPPTPSEPGTPTLPYRRKEAAQERGFFSPAIGLTPRQHIGPGTDANETRDKDCGSKGGSY